MKTYLTGLAILVIAITAFAQVDTLSLVEIDSLVAPSMINKMYIENITDSTKAIFLCTDNYIYAYDSQTRDLIWTSPEMAVPNDLQFADINNDGYCDIAAHDSINIYLFDVVNNQTIWTSPELDSTYGCYTIGDRNSDGVIDLVISRLYKSDTTSIYDTLRTTIYDGPNYSFTGYFNTLLNSENEYYSVTETPSTIRIIYLTYNDELKPYIAIFTNTYYNSGDYLYSGKAYIIDGFDFTELINFNSGELLTLTPYIQNGYNKILMLNYFHGGAGLHRYLKLAVNIYMPNEITNLTLFEYYDFLGGGCEGIVGNLISSDDINICYYRGTNDELSGLYFYSVNNQAAQWFDVDSSGYFEDLISAFSYPGLYENMQILMHIGNLNYELIDASDGSISAFFTTAPYHIKNISDFSLDGNDEILCLDNATIRIFGIDSGVGIDNPQAAIPNSTYISANYPNPFNPTTTIEYGLSSAQHVNIAIYDILGRKIETLVDETQPAGSHQVTWNADKVASGVYFYKISTDDYSNVRKMILLK